MDNAEQERTQSTPAAQQPTPTTAPPRPAPPIIKSIHSPILIDCAGLDGIAALLRPILGDIEFVVKSSDLDRRTGVSAETVTSKALYGNTYATDIWIVQRGGSHGVYFEPTMPDYLRLFLPPGSDKVADEILRILRRYRAPYSWFVRQVEFLEVMFFIFVLSPYFGGCLVSILTRNPERVQETIRAIFRKDTEGAAPTGSGSAWVGLVLSVVMGLLGGWLLRYVLFPLRGFWRFAFPSLAFDVPSNVARNEGMKRFRWALLSFPLASLSKGIFW